MGKEINTILPTRREFEMETISAEKTKGMYFAAQGNSIIKVFYNKYNCDNFVSEFNAIRSGASAVQKQLPL
jgi:hypothetical protein